MALRVASLLPLWCFGVGVLVFVCLGVLLFACFLSVGLQPGWQLFLNLTKVTCAEPAYIAPRGAAQTFSKRCLADKCAGLAVAVSRKSSHLLSEHRTCTIPPSRCFRCTSNMDMCPPNKKMQKKAHAAAYVQSLHEHTWKKLATRITCKGAMRQPTRLQRLNRDELEFFSTIDLTNPLGAPPERAGKWESSFLPQPPILLAFSMQPFGDGWQHSSLLLTG